MSISILPNQSLAFNLDNSNKCNTRYFLPVQRGDQVNLQGISTVFSGGGNKVSLSGASWSLGAGFSMTGGVLSHTSQTSVSTAQSGSLNLAPGKLYRFYCRVSFSGLSFATAGQGIIIKVNGNPVQLPDTPLGQGYRLDFQVTTFFSPASITNNTVEITTNYPSVAFQVSDLQVIEFSSPTVTAYDLSGRAIQTLNPNGSYFTAPDYVSAFNAVTQTPFDMHLSLDALPDGCCYLVIGEKQPIGDTFFCNNGFWSTGGWIITGNHANSNSTANILTGVPQLLQAETYTLNFTVSGLSSHVHLYVKLDFGDGSPVDFYITTNGNESITFVSGGTGLYVNTNLTFQVVYAHLGYTDPVNVSLSAVYFKVGSLHQSNYISFQTAFPFPTLLLTATNNDNAFNFNYSNGLTHNIRLWAKMRYKDYKTQADEANFSDNSNVLMTAYLEKIYEVIIGDAAEFVHDCLSMMQINDTFTISATPYIRDGHYAVKRRKSTELAPATFDVKAVQGISKNWNIN